MTGTSWGAQFVGGSVGGISGGVESDNCPQTLAAAVGVGSGEWVQKPTVASAEGGGCGER